MKWYRNSGEIVDRLQTCPKHKPQSHKGKDRSPTFLQPLKTSVRQLVVRGCRKVFEDGNSVSLVGDDLLLVVCFVCYWLVAGLQRHWISIGFQGIEYYGVVYGSPCGRPEKVCWFILPWLLALRRTGLVLKRTVVILSWVALKIAWVTRRFGQVDSPSSGVAWRGRRGCIIRRCADAEVITRMWSAPRGLLRARLK